MLSAEVCANLPAVVLLFVVAAGVGTLAGYMIGQLVAYRRHVAVLRDHVEARLRFVQEMRAVLVTGHAKVVRRVD